VQLGFEPDYIVVATGSGGTQAGLIAGKALFELSSKIIAFNVSDDAAYFEAKIREDFRAWKRRYRTSLDVEKLAITTAEGYLGPGYGRAGPEVFDTIAALAGCEGLFLDPVYTGKAFHGMVKELHRAEQGESSVLSGARNVLFIHTGGLFGLFPQRQGFAFN
jgi:D-cysteine desulfhydrase